jgi:FAD/FMN-containing dehydrogenase
MLKFLRWKKRDRKPAEGSRIGRALRRTVRLAVGAVLTVAGITLAMTIAGILQTTVIHAAPGPVVNDVTRLNPVVVDRVIAPTREEEIVAAVRSHPGPISVGGGRFSMGGQTATEGALQIDMRRYNRIVDLNVAARTITVQSGATWRSIQEAIDRHGLSVKVMQSYGNFTVGGSLSVNVHGRYAGLGPLISTVRAIRLVLADGSVVDASPGRNAELFYGAIGGYGGLGVITQATLELAPNVRVRRQRITMPVTDYARYFRENVRGRPGVIFHNGDIYPNEYDRVSVISFTETSDPVTVPDRLIPRGTSYAQSRTAYRVITGWPGGKEFREHLLDPWRLNGDQVVWRNYEASYDVAELEPASREKYTYVLQEYFIPVESFDRFVPRMRRIFQRHDVNVMNVSIRHATPDPGSLLAWAPREVFAFVVYYKQGTGRADREKVGRWTREMADAALALGGSWYLPYQPHATPAQFARAYPRSAQFFALKRRVDPTNKFRNKLWDRYDPAGPMRFALPAAQRTAVDSMPGYRREESQSYMSHPEWYIVYSADELGEYTRTRLPTDFPYAASIGQFWRNWSEVSTAMERDHRANSEYLVMLGVIGTSFSVEMALKGIYETTIGRLSGWTSGGRLTDEDRFAHRVAADYGHFLHTIPWYRYPYGQRLRELWTEVPMTGPGVIRKWERRLVLTLEFGVKAAYARLIAFATGAAYGAEDLRMGIVVYGDTASLAPGDSNVISRRPLGANHSLLVAQRYDAFRDLVVAAARRGESTPLVEIAGNDDIVVSGLAPRGWRYRGSDAEYLYALPLPTDPRTVRPVLKVRTHHLLRFLREVEREGMLRLDHVYDY